MASEYRLGSGGARTQESSGSTSVFDPRSSDNDYGLLPGAGGVRKAMRSPRGSTYASDTFAQLTRDQWASYMQNFVDYEDKLIEYSSNPSVVAQGMFEASRDVNTAFDNQQAASGRRLQSLGLTLSPDEQAASTRSFGLARSLADVQGQNSVRDAIRARQQSIVGSPTPKLGLS